MFILPWLNLSRKLLSAGMIHRFDSSNNKSLLKMGLNDNVCFEPIIISLCLARVTATLIRLQSFNNSPTLLLLFERTNDTIIQDLSRPYKKVIIIIMTMAANYENEVSTREKKIRYMKYRIVHEVSRVKNKYAQ